MSARASASTSTRSRLSTWRGAIMMLASAVRWGNRLYCWNTMPTLRRSLSLSSLGSLTSWPATVIEPESIGRSALMQRSRADDTNHFALHHVDRDAVDDDRGAEF